MSLVALILLSCLLGITACSLLVRNWELRAMSATESQIEVAKEEGSHKARLQYPQVDLAKCIGCGSCVTACPEEGVLELLHGQAMVVHGARCVGHGRCATECPTAGIVVRLGDIENRRDIPILEEDLSCIGTPGLYLAGEVTGFALVRTAIEQGRMVAQAVAKERKQQGSPTGDRALDPDAPPVRDLVVVGLGPAGLSCGLEALNHGLDFVVAERDRLGGAVAHYPRQKMVLTRPVNLPRGGRLKESEYSKEELLDIWQTVAKEQQLPIQEGLDFSHIDPRDADGIFQVHFTNAPSIRTRSVCLAMGRRGTPRKLGVPGEESSKVSYGLVDAGQFQGDKILVVGGGDSAIEAALALSEQVGNHVTLSYRRPSVFRIKTRNKLRLEEAIARGTITALFSSTVTRIHPDSVELEFADSDQMLGPKRIENNVVFVLAGGLPPFEQLERSGVSFDPSERPATVASDDHGGLLVSLLWALASTLGALLWLGFFRDYYALSSLGRPGHADHQLLAPSGSAGLAFGILAFLFIGVNLLYLARKNHRFPLQAGTLRSWMTWHVATGILAFIAATLHSFGSLRQSVGTHAFLGIGILVVTGALGRYLYSFIPRAANGRSLDLGEVRAKLAAFDADWDREHRGFGERLRLQIENLTTEAHWSGPPWKRLSSLIKSRARLRNMKANLTREARQEGIPEPQIRKLLKLAASVQRSALAAAHLEDIRGIVASWRYAHRWIALLMVGLVLIHIVTALRYGQIL
jgi:thioredoxin reductase/Pyruvate/2-oxoacid:ferredoxin oxidoreductase delta subunit